MKEPEAQEPRCPAPDGCGGLGDAVPRDLVRGRLRAGVRVEFAASAYFCPNPKCAVAYFDNWGGLVLVDAVVELPYPKNPAGVLCACLGVRPEEIVEEAKTAAPCRIREIIAASNQDPARCRALMPNGRSCAEDARKLFYRSAAR